jgi:hypothetical protein
VRGQGAACDFDDVAGVCVLYEPTPMER